MDITSEPETLTETVLDVDITFASGLTFQLTLRPGDEIVDHEHEIAVQISERRVPVRHAEDITIQKRNVAYLSRRTRVVTIPVPKE